MEEKKIELEELKAKFRDLEQENKEIKEYVTVLNYLKQNYQKDYEDLQEQVKDLGEIIENERKEYNELLNNINNKNLVSENFKFLISKLPQNSPHRRPLLKEISKYFL